MDFKENSIIVCNENVKKNILKQLELLNISDSTMYPDKDHTSKAIKKYYRS